MSCAETLDKEGHLNVFTDKFDGTVPRDRKLVALVVEDEVQPKTVDVTAKQEQARALADASFEAKSKAPEKRKEKELSAPLANEMSQDDTPKAGSSAEAKTEDKAAEPAKANESAIAAVSTAKPASAEAKSSEPKSPAAKKSDYKASSSVAQIKANAQGSGSAPKNKKGALDPKRLPDTDRNTEASNTATAKSDSVDDVEK